MSISLIDICPDEILQQECIPVGCVPPAAVAVGGWGSVSVHAGMHPPGVGLETPLGCGPGDPPRCGPGDHPGVDLETTPGFGLETPHPSQTPQLPPWVWAWKPTRHAGIPPSRQRPAARHAGIPPAMHAGIRPPLDRMPDMCKNITFANIVCGR